MHAILYFLTATVCLSMFYLAYRLFFRKDTNFRHLRFYLLVSIALSLLLPLHQYRISTRLSVREKAKPTALVISAEVPAKAALQTEEPYSTFPGKTLLGYLTHINWLYLAIGIYLMVTLILLARIGIQLTVLFIQYRKSDKIQQNDCVLLYNHRFGNTFSFFNWIFVNDKGASPEDFKQIIAHEKIHVAQFHSFDILLIELLTAVMWFNPLIWMMKHSMQLVHEYLADEGALSTGIDRLRYQVLLINQVTEERLICLSSSFNHALIKKRMIMMTTNKINKGTTLKVFTLIPVSLLLLFMVAMVNGIFTESAIAGDEGQPHLTAVTENAGSATPEQSLLPPDTIRKKTIIKTISKENPNDTIVKETEEIIVVDDASKGDKMTWEMKDDEDGKGNKVMIFIDEDGEKTHTMLHGDSAMVVTVIKTSDGGEDKIIKEEKHIEIRHVDVEETSKILYIVDGVQRTDGNVISTLDPDQIESIDVIKGAGIKKYTDKDYEGVFVIATKAAKKK